MTKQVRRKRQTMIVSASAVLAFLVLTAADSIEAAIIRLKTRATVTSGVVTLADVADIFDRDEETVRQLKSITLLPAPPAGGQMKLDFAAVRARLQTQGFNLAHLDFTGSSVVVVSAPASRRVEPNAKPDASKYGSLRVNDWQLRSARKLLSTAIRNSLRTANLGDVSIEVEFDRSLTPLILSGSRSGYEVRGGRAPWDAWQLLTVRFIDRDEQLQTLQVRCLFTKQPLVPTVNQALPRGRIIRREDVVLERNSTPNGAHLSLEDVLGRETKRSLRQGEPIAAGDIREVPLVRRNDIVTASARVGGITVRRQLKARGDAALGEPVLLVSLDGRQQIEATVVGYHEAEVLSAAPVRSGRRTAVLSDRSQFPPSNPAVSNQHPTATLDSHRPFSAPSKQVSAPATQAGPVRVQKTQRTSNGVVSNRPMSIARTIQSSSRYRR